MNIYIQRYRKSETQLKGFWKEPDESSDGKKNPKKPLLGLT